MRAYTCIHCLFTFSEADKAWDTAIDSGRCPECLELIRDFPVPTREETLPPIPTHSTSPKLSEQKSPQQPAQQEEKPSIKVPYPWGSVLGWVSVAFLVGLITARPTWKSATSIDRTALGVLVGMVYAILTAAIVGSWKYFKRTSSPQFECSIWRKVTVEEAKKHPLYGLGGLLGWFAFSSVFGLLLDLGRINVEALKIEVSLGGFLDLDTPLVKFLKVALAIDALAVTTILWFLFSKHQSFRKVSSCILVALWPTEALVGVVVTSPDLAYALAVNFVPYVGYCAVWVPYLQRSKRVRVTFEHALRVVQGSEENLSNSSPASKAKDKLPDIPIQAGPSQGTIRASEDRLYEQIAEELEANCVDKGLWTKAYAQAGGDDRQTRVFYIKERFERLLAMENARE